MQSQVGVGFERGYWSFGDKCRNFHSKEEKKKKETICKFFLKGKCFYGEKCRFQHYLKLDALLCADYLMYRSCPMNDKCDKVHVG